MSYCYSTILKMTFSMQIESFVSSEIIRETLKGEKLYQTTQCYQKVTYNSWHFLFKKYFKFRVCGLISCFILEEKIWGIFHGSSWQTQLRCSSPKCMFLTNLAPGKSERNRLFNCIRFIVKEYYCNKEIIHQIWIFLLFVKSVVLICVSHRCLLQNFPT